MPAAYRDFALHNDGRQALAALWDVLDSAQHSIDVCTFILGRDAIGKAVIARLCAKAKSGVKVRLLLDGLGSLMAGRPRMREEWQVTPGTTADIEDAGVGTDDAAQDKIKQVDVRTCER